MSHLKRIAAPKNWEIARKAATFFARPNPGMHSYDYGVPLVFVMREKLQLGKTRKEIRDILNKQEVLVDGKRRKDHKFNVGFMDVVTFPKLKKSYRVVINARGKIDVIEINEKEANQKIVRVKNKTMVKGKLQLNLSDGRNVLAEKGTYKVNDCLVIELPSQKILNHFAFEKGAAILLIGGRHMGTQAVVESIEGDTLVIRTGDNEMYETTKKNAYVIGKEKAHIQVQ